MRKSKQRAANKLFLVVGICAVLVMFYFLWFALPYALFFVRSGVLRVFFYPTSALVRNTNGIVTITLYGAGTTVVRYDINRKKIILTPSGSKAFADTNKGAGYYLIFDDSSQTGLARAQLIIDRLTDIRFILMRNKYIEYVNFLNTSVRKNISPVELMALWRMYLLNKSQFTIIQQ
jgi:hypothetical protein